MGDQVAMRKLADDHGLLFIEDAAHAFGIQGPEAMAGSVGDFAVYSFHETKNIQCGEGGALQINNSDYVERAQVLREKGTNRARFREGLVDKYTWIDHGSSWLLADPLAAILLGQLEEYENVQDARRQVFERYQRDLTTWSEVTGFQIDEAPVQQENAAHIFAIEAPSLDLRNAMLMHLRDRSVGATFHYQTLHDSPAGKKLGRTHGEVVVGKRLSETVIRLPLFVELTPEEQGHVIQSVREFIPFGQQRHKA
jgi:dTDP-4-amino-4,6-dideoxygalactose transaminase